MTLLLIDESDKVHINEDAHARLRVFNQKQTPPDEAIYIQIADQEHKLTLRREHGLNQKYLKFHLDNIYVAG